MIFLKKIFWGADTTATLHLVVSLQSHHNLGVLASNGYECFQLLPLATEDGESSSPQGGGKISDPILGEEKGGSVFRRVENGENHEKQA